MSQNRMKTLGQIGYEAYAVATGGKTWDGRDMPTWEQVLASGTKVAVAWAAAADAIVVDVFRSARTVQDITSRLTSADSRRFRKKSVVITAYQTPTPLEIPTLEGVMTAQPGDWIITGINGEQYPPCKPDIFEKTYEPVSEDHATKTEGSEA